MELLEPSFRPVNLIEIQDDLLPVFFFFFQQKETEKGKMYEEKRDMIGDRGCRRLGTHESLFDSARISPISLSTLLHIGQPFWNVVLVWNILVHTRTSTKARGQEAAPLSDYMGY